jgi:hypothetical protein
MVRLIKKSVGAEQFAPLIVIPSGRAETCYTTATRHLAVRPTSTLAPLRSGVLFLALAGPLTSTILLPRRIAPELLSYKSVTWLGADRAEESPVSSSTPLAIFAIRPLLPVRSHSLVRNLKELFRLSTVRAQGSHRRPITGVVRFPSFLCGPSFPQIAAFRRGSFLILGEQCRRNPCQYPQIAAETGVSTVLARAT